jgi:radical SAM superfamily enzyme YgiQ (UPF0313 family)
VQPKDTSEEIIAMLKKAGCRTIAASIEAGIEGVRLEILKRNHPDDVLMAALRRPEAAGIKTQSNTMIALSGTTLEEDFASVAFTRKCGPTLPTFSAFTPYEERSNRVRGDQSHERRRRSEPNVR